MALIDRGILKQLGSALQSEATLGSSRYLRGGKTGWLFYMYGQADAPGHLISKVNFWNLVFNNSVMSLENTQASLNSQAQVGVEVWLTLEFFLVGVHVEWKLGLPVSGLRWPVKTVRYSLDLQNPAKSCKSRGSDIHVLCKKTHGNCPGHQGYEYPKSHQKDVTLKKPFQQ